MKMKQLLLVLLASPAFLINSCQNEFSSEFPVNTVPEAPVNDAERVTASITGIVVNENDIPITGITVTSSGSNMVTDHYGMFRFKNISLSKANASVKVEKNGYFTAIRTFPAAAGRNHNVRIKLIPKTNAGSFSAAAGGTVTISGGGKLVIPATAVTDASGNSYSGTVNVAMTWINPTSPDLGSIIMGDLRGVTTGGQERVLETYGMLGVELTGAGGQALKIASGKTAELTFPIPAALQGGAPASITLWHFDEATARWKEEGTATKTGSNYVASVSHFSFWNCDAPWPQITLCMTLLNSNNQPLANVPVRIKRVNVPSSVATGYTDSLGNLCGIVPKNEPLIMEVLSPCGVPVFTQNIGPFSSNTSLGNVTVNIPAVNQVLLTGNVVNCSNQPVTNGYVFIYYSGGNYTTANITNGSFSANIINCSANTLNFSVSPVDHSAQQQGNPVSSSGISGIVNMGTLSACGISSVEYIQFMIDGSPLNFNNPPDSITCHSNTLSQPPAAYGFKTIISAMESAPNPQNWTLFDFYHNGVTGTYPITGFGVATPATAGVSYTIVGSPVMNITEMGLVNIGFISGNCNVQLRRSAPLNYTQNITCTFRVRRR